ncbi:MAG TPA: outer membrane beta-barrel protein [Bacteroidales bacterium]|nr:outer membrane beta-barrel protein [Bacteroidales bacterium]
MNTNNHHIDELFARELGNIEIEPPQSVWLGIEKKLDKKKRLGIIYFRMGMAAGLALLFSLSGIYWYNHSSRKDTIIVATTDNNKAFSAPSTDKKQANTATNEAVVSIKSTEPVKTAYHSYNSHNNQPPVADRQTTIKMKTLEEEDVHAYANDNSQITNGNVTEQTTELAYLEPKTGLLITIQPVREPLYEELKSASSEEIPATTQLANVETNVRINRWSIEAQVAPLYSYRNITSSSALNADFNNNESGLVSYSNVIKVNYQTSKRLTIQAGIAYSVIGQTLRNIYIQQPASNVGLKYSSTNTSSRVNTSFGLIINSTDQEPLQMDNATARYTFFNTVGTEKMSAYAGQNAVVTTQSNADIIQRMQVIEIPIMARYYILTGKFNWHLTGGLSTNILVGNDALLHNNNQKEKIGETANLKRLNYSGIVGTGLGYAIKRNIILTIEPTFKYYMNSISTTGIKVHPYSFGLYTGICYKL